MSNWENILNPLLYKNLYAKIPDYVSPDWFEQKNFEWM